MFLAAHSSLNPLASAPPQLICVSLCVPPQLAAAWSQSQAQREAYETPWELSASSARSSRFGTRVFDCTALALALWSRADSTQTALGARSELAGGPARARAAPGHMLSSQLKKPYMTHTLAVATAVR